MTLDSNRERTAERAANQLIEDLRIVDPGEIDIEAVSMTKGALVLDGGISGAEARLIRSPKLSIIRVNNTIRETGRRRFAIAHELGHLLLQQGRSQLALCSDKDLIPFYTNSPDELEASAFAGALLMPQTLFRPLCERREPSLALIADLGARFQVTLTAAATRYIQFSPYRCCLVISTDGKVCYYRATNDFGYFISPGEKLDPGTYAADYFKGDKLPTGMHAVKAAAWLQSRKIERGITIMEDSLAMPFYNSVLTLLWIDKDIDQYVIGKDEYDAEERESNRRWSWNRYRDRD